MTDDPPRRLPRVDRVVADAALASARARIGRGALTALTREVLAELRARVVAGEPPAGHEQVVREVADRADARARSQLRRVINATGVILHTNLGRAPLPKASLDAIAALAGGYTSLELDVSLGVRTRRGIFAEAAMAALTGAADALLVNNNAAAVLLALSTLAARREVIVSRGELVEIGGGFRIPEVLARSGARLVEVGTTNRTRVEDYQRALGPDTACVLRVHPSNFRISGFTERPTLSALSALCTHANIPLVKDLGGGLVLELPDDVLCAAERAREPTVQACLHAGANLVCFSLDKLFGGPQGGVIVGDAELVRQLRDDPLARALRVDKLTLAALEPLLAGLARGEYSAVPALSMLLTPVSALEARVRRWQAELGVSAQVVRSEAAIGGGTLAEASLESRALAISSLPADALARALRGTNPPVLCRVHDGRVLVDARTVLPGEDAELVAAIDCAARALAPGEKA